MSVSFLGVPSGFEGSVLISPSKPIVFATKRANSKILTSRLVPTFTQSGGLSSSHKWRIASAKSSTCKNSLSGVPVPQMVTEASPRTFAS